MLNMVITEAEITNLWGRVLSKIKTRLDDRNIYSNFFETTYVYDISNNNIVVVVPGELAKGLIEKRYLELIEQAVQEVTESIYNIELICDSDVHDFKKSEKKDAAEAAPKFENNL